MYVIELDICRPCKENQKTGCHRCKFCYHRTHMHHSDNVIGEDGEPIEGYGVDVECYTCNGKNINGGNKINFALFISFYCT